MRELFRVRIAGKRQMTIPQRMMNVIGIEEGDELQFTVEGKDIVKTVHCKTVPAHLVPEDVAAAIAKSRKDVKEGRTGDIDRLARRMREVGTIPAKAMAAKAKAGTS
jgi:bifunctional DNA-binding transcriptional regulator/antitoxin component of YhaV-PrlF toxin-antitoxin module